MKVSSLQERISIVADKIQNNNGLRVLTTAFMSTLPALFIGALLALIQGLPLGDGYTTFLAETGISSFLAAGVTVCNCIALFFVISYGYHLGDMKKVDKFLSSIVALICFLFVTPLTASTYNESSQLITVDNAISTSWLSAQGLFSAIIVGVVSINVYSFFIKKNIKIRMPEAVPSSVAKPFEAVVPAIITSTLFMLVRIGFSFTPFENMHQFIYSVIQIPLTSMGSSFPSFMICIFLVSLFWWLGIHGSLLVATVMYPIWSPFAIDNLNAFMSGSPLPYFLTFVFFYIFMQFIGGPGCLIGLAIDMPLFAKSKRYKTMGKIAFVPGIFNIVEPMIFGFPIVLNPIMVIPFLFTPLLFMGISYLLMVIGVLAVPVLDIGVMTVPSFVAGFLVGGGWQWGILLIVFTLLSCLIYLPFLKICDRQALKEEELQIQI